MRLIVLLFLALLIGCNSQKSGTDKTLVSWVKLNDPEVTGGTVLSIWAGEQFDGIVLSEEGTWINGSEKFIRTGEEAGTETDLPEKEFIQVAIVYKGGEIMTCLDGELQSTYPAENIDLLSSNSNYVAFGPSHHQEQGWVAASIEDARIYSSALTPEELDNLKPDEPSEIEPYAWFDFEGKEITEKTGRYTRFYMGEYENAVLKDGKLVLRGWGRLVAYNNYLPEKPSWPDDPPENWPTFHLAHPGPGWAEPGDPNAALYHNGKYHLHYIYDNFYGFSFGHVTSDDLVYWDWQPTLLTPPFTGHGMFSGTGFYTLEGQPAIIYHGFGSGYNQLVFALDDSLNKWTEPAPLKPKTVLGEDGDMWYWDPDLWIMNDTYYALSGGRDPEMMKSADLENWILDGKLLHDDYPGDLGVSREEDISCANMFPIGDKWMLLCISHRLGCRYFLGDFKEEKYLPEFHALMQWHDEEETLNFFAPESLLAPDGRRIMWAWMVSGNQPSGIQSLPRELELPDDGILRIRPLTELEKLRYDEWSADNIPVTSGEPYPLQEISGDALEIMVTFNAPSSKEFGVNLLPGNELSIAAGSDKIELTIGTINPPFELQDGEDLTLRIFIDKNLLEVFANDRQAAAYTHEDLTDELKLSLFTEDSDVLVKELKVWKIKSIYTNQNDK